MNPLIDVCLVLLVFFILATTMAVMEKVLSVPEAKQAEPGQVQRVEEDLTKVMILVEARMKDGRPVIKLENQEVTPDGLMIRLRNIRDRTQMSQVVIDAKDVDWQTIVTVIDACTGAGIQKVNFKVDKPAAGGGARPTAPAR